MATLALHDGEVVGSGRLIQIVWGKPASPALVNTLQSHLSYLRHALGSKTVILARSPGYVFNLGEGDTDVRCVERLLQQGQQATGASEAVQRLGEALALWRGVPLADVTGLAWLEEQAERLDELRLRVQRMLVEARLSAGEHAQLVPGLEQMLAETPLDEQLHAMLMVALYRAGRQADALAAYHRLRHILGEELGIDPGQRLRELQAAILRQDPSLDAPAPTPAALTPAAAVPVMRQAPTPAQLPSAVTGFAGRAAELASLDALVPRAVDTGVAKAGTGAARSDAVVISVISGTAGVGKTALAVHWAHRVAARFPDGQLYVNLRGFDSGRPPLGAAEALRGLLDALGVPVAGTPADLDAQAALYRSLLAGKRVLVVLDNARDADQVRPLLPGSPACMAIVTSRNYLTGLVAADGARPLSLKMLTTAEARDLLIRRLGEDQVAADPAAASEIIERCARLPLALAIVTARAAAPPGFPLAVMAAQLRQAVHALDPFDGGDTATDTRAVFSWSYHALSPDAARLFRLLGLHPGPDIAVAAAASLADASVARAGALLGELTRAHLLSEHAPGRFTCHDLLRAYASEQAGRHDSPEARDAAIRRVLDHYLHTSHTAAVLIEPYLSLPFLARPRPGTIVGEPVNAEDAECWFSAEQAALLACVKLAADTGLETHTWQLAWTLTSFLLRRGLWGEQAAASSAALEVTRRTGDETGEAHSLACLADGYARSGREAAACPLFHRALRLFETIGDLTSQAAIHSDLAWLAGRAQRPAEALRRSLRARDLFRATGHRAGEARALNNIGYSHAQLGDYQQALAHCERSLKLVQQIGARSWEATVWCSLAYIRHHLGDYKQAIACYQRSVGICRERADRYNEAAALGRLGDVHHRAGDTAAAHRAWAQALHIFDQIGHPDGDKLRLAASREP